MVSSFVGPKIVVEDLTGYTITFSPFRSNGGFVIAVYSLYEVISYSFSKDDGQVVEVFVTLLFQSEWETVTRYQIGFPVIDKDSDGNYSFSVTDKDQKTEIQTLTIIKAQGIAFMLFLLLLMLLNRFCVS